MTALFLIHMGRSRIELQSNEAADVSLWTEALFTAELLLLHAAPVYYGMGVTHGNGSGIILVPGLLAPDFYLQPMHSWLSRIGYAPYFAGIACNAHCPNLLIEGRLNDAIERALAETGRKVHLIGHSLGGIIARSIAAQRPRDVASVITLAAPFRGTVAHKAVLRIVDMVRDRILDECSTDVLPDCYTTRCTCDFMDSLRRSMPKSVLQTAIYTEQDGIVDWRYCKIGDLDADIGVTGTHIGLVFNPSVYSAIARRLAEAESRDLGSKPHGRI